MVELTDNEIRAEFTKRFIKNVKRTKCPYCSRPTQDRTGEHYSCYLEASDAEKGQVLVIRNQAMQIR